MRKNSSLTPHSIEIQFKKKKPSDGTDGLNNLQEFIMLNFIEKKPIRQKKLNRHQKIQIAQFEWKEKAQKAVNKKEELGYKDFDVEAFCEIDLDTIFDQTLQSQIIALQEEYKGLIEEKKILWLEDNIVSEFNKVHAVIHIDQTYILTEKYNSLGGQDFSLESRQSFKAYYEDETVICIDGIERSKADIWLKSPNRKKYKGIIFDPRITESKDGYYNLWKGFAKKPAQGNCDKYWNHVKENICNNNQEAYVYIRKWLAYVFQRPHEVHTALVLCGSQGVGKNSFVEPLGILLGAHYAPLSSISELVSNFNYHLKNAVLIHANEALWGGNKKEIGTVKAMITEQTCLIEGKGKDRIVVRNFKHVILSSNEDWPVHLDPDDRRFFVLNVSDACKEDHDFFKFIKVELDNGGYEALLYDLLNEDLTAFDPRKMPESFSSFGIKIRSVDSAHRYLYEVLCEGGFSVGNENEDEFPVWQAPILKDMIYKDYISWCQQSGEKYLSKELLGRVIKKIIISVEDKRPAAKVRKRCYVFPSLRQARKDFCKSFKENPQNIFDSFEYDQ